jgi:hypothetical protein
MDREFVAGPEKIFDKKDTGGINQILPKSNGSRIDETQNQPLPGICLDKNALGREPLFLDTEGISFPEYAV